MAIWGDMLGNTLFEHEEQLDGSTVVKDHFGNVTQRYVPNIGGNSGTWYNNMGHMIGQELEIGNQTQHLNAFGHLQSYSMESSLPNGRTEFFSSMGQGIGNFDPMTNNFSNSMGQLIAHKNQF